MQMQIFFYMYIFFIFLKPWISFFRYTFFARADTEFGFNLIALVLTVFHHRLKQALLCLIKSSQKNVASASTKNKKLYLKN